MGEVEKARAKFVSLVQKFGQMLQYWERLPALFVDNKVKISRVERKERNTKTTHRKKKIPRAVVPKGKPKTKRSDVQFMPTITAQLLQQLQAQLTAATSAAAAAAAAAQQATAAVKSMKQSTPPKRSPRRSTPHHSTPRRSPRRANHRRAKRKHSSPTASCSPSSVGSSPSLSPRCKRYLNRQFSKLTQKMSGYSSPAMMPPMFAAIRPRMLYPPSSTPFPMMSMYNNTYFS